MPVEQNLLHGLLVVDKPGRPLPTEQPLAAQRLWTSHDIVARVRRLSGQRRIGHTGTLDPMASGVLVLCLGVATRLVEYYQGEAKQYDAEVVLGAATDTYDAEGRVVAQAPVPPLRPATIEAALERWRGEVWQEPPAYSAIKQEGETLYAKARRGETVSAPPRRVHFYRIDLVEWQPPNRLRLNVVCSAGAYVRSLAHDLGRSLDTYGFLDLLRRRSAGAFSLAQAHTLDEIETSANRGELNRLLLAAGESLPLPAVQLDADLRSRFGHGQHVLLSLALCPPTQPLMQVRDETGALAGIIRSVQTENDSTQTPLPAAMGLWKAEKWLT